MVPMVMLWSPHCVCNEGYSRLPNGNCVAIDDPRCVALWKPSRGMLKSRCHEFFFSSGITKILLISIYSAMHSQGK